MSAELAGNTYLPKDPDEFVSWAFKQRGGLQLMADRIRRVENELAALRADASKAKEEWLKRGEVIDTLRATLAEQARALAERNKFIEAYDAWAMDEDHLCGGELFDRMLEARDFISAHPAPEAEPQP